MTTDGVSVEEPPASGRCRNKYQVSRCRESSHCGKPQFEEFLRENSAQIPCSRDRSGLAG